MAKDQDEKKKSKVSAVSSDDEMDFLHAEKLGAADLPDFDFFLDDPAPPKKSKAAKE